MKLWTDKVKDMQGRVCAICGSKDGADNGKGGRSWTNAHHIEDRSNYALRWDVLNGIAVCPSHHEFGKDSFHRSPVWSLDWVKRNRPKVIEYILANRETRPQMAKDYSREDMIAIIARLSMPPTAAELEILGLDRPEHPEPATEAPDRVDGAN